MLYAFAILTAPPLDDKPVGLQHDAITYIQVGDLIAAVEPNIDIQTLQQSPEEVLMMAVVRHDRVICELFAQRTILPLRFGTAFISEAALTEFLQAQQQIFLERLQRLKGKAEYLIKGKFTQPKAAPLPELKGRDYLLAKRHQYEQLQEMRSRQQQELKQIHNLLQDCSQIQLGTAQESEDVRAYILLNTERLSSLQAALEQWQIQHPSWQLNLSDPLPPYHFADSI